MKALDFEKVSAEAYRIAKEKGFCDAPLNRGEVFMLINSELVEAMEADRDDKRAFLDKFRQSIEDVKAREDINQEQYWTECFKVYIKDTIEDELADTFIRLGNYMGSVPGVDILWKSSGSWAHLIIGRMEQTENFPEKLFILSEKLHEAYLYESRQKIALTAFYFGLKHLCFRMKIDIALHIDLKMRYNSSRKKLWKKY